MKFAQIARETTMSLRRSLNFTQGQGLGQASVRVNLKNAYLLMIKKIDMVSEICPNCSQNNHVSTSKLKFCLGLGLAQGQSQKCIFSKNKKFDMVSEICSNCSRNNRVSTSKLKFYLGLGLGLGLGQGQSHKCI